MSRQPAVPSSDRISALPDDVLCRILSFLPTKQAVATGTLSKRWRPLWLSVPTLHFDDQHLANHLELPHIISAVTFSQGTALPLLTFRLRCSSSQLSPSDVDAWVHAAMQRGVETLEFHLPFRFPHGPPIKLPSRLLSCRTLAALKLKEMRLDSLSDVDFPMLKTLRLEGVIMDSHECLTRLLFGCPVLEDLLYQVLSIARQRQRQHREVGLVESLPKLVRADVCHFPFPLTLLSKVEFLRLNMAYLDCNDIPSFQNLIHLEFCVTPHMPWNWLVAMLEHCPKLQNLVVDKLPRWLTRRRDIYDDWEDTQVVPECLSSQLRTCCFRNYGGVECELQFARYIMQNSRILRSMTVTVLTEFQHEMPDMLRKLSLCPRISTTCKLSAESCPGQ